MANSRMNHSCSSDFWCFIRYHQRRYSLSLYPLLVWRSRFSPMEPEPKRRCEEYSLLMHSAPTKFTLSQIGGFFTPILLKKYECLHATKKGSLRKIGFFSQADMESVLHGKQWQYIDDYCIRLSTVEEDPSLDGGEHWNIIHRDLQQDILSYFDVFDRRKFRRVCKDWNGVLKHHWDAEVNRCLYFDFASFYRRNTFLEGKVEKVLRCIDKSSGGRCSRVPRLILKFVDGTELFEADLKYDLHGRLFGSGKSCFFDEYLIRHSHFSTVMIIGIDLDDIDFTGKLFRFGDTARWPRELRVIFHQCTFRMTHYFPSQIEQCDHGDPPVYGPDADFFIAEPMDYVYSIHVEYFTVKFGPEINEEERYKRLHVELDKRRILWPFPAKQLKWLKSLLAKCPLDECVYEAGGSSFGEAIRWYLNNDPIRVIMGGEWEPTGVFFEGIQLSWRDCLFFALLTKKWGLLGTTRAPCVMKEFKIEVHYEATWEQPAETEAQIAEFKRQVARLENDGPGHCVFFPIGPSNLKMPEQDEELVAHD